MPKPAPSSDTQNVFATRPFKRRKLCPIGNFGQFSPDGKIHVSVEKIGHENDKVLSVEVFQTVTFHGVDIIMCHEYDWGHIIIRVVSQRCRRLRVGSRQSQCKLL